MKVKGILENGKFFPVEEDKTIGKIRILKDAETKKYFVGSEDALYNPQYDEYEVVGDNNVVNKLVLAVKGSKYDVFWDSGVCLVENVKLKSRKSTEKFSYLCFEKEDKTPIFLYRKQKYFDAYYCLLGSDNPVKAISEVHNDFIVAEYEDENVLYDISGKRFVHFMEIKKLLVFDKRFRIIEIEEQRGWPESYYYVYVENVKKAQGICLFTFEENKCVDCSGKEIQELLEAKIVAFDYSKVYYDPKLKAHIGLDKDGFKTLIKDNQVLKATRALDIVEHTDIDFYFCKVSTDSEGNEKVKIVTKDGHLLDTGYYKYEEANFCTYDMRRKYLIVKDVVKKQYVHISWSDPVYNFLHSGLDIIVHDVYIDDKGISNIVHFGASHCFFIYYEDGSINYYYWGKFIKKYPKGTKIHFCDDGVQIGETITTVTYGTAGGFDGKIKNTKTTRKLIVGCEEKEWAEEEESYIPRPKTKAEKEREEFEEWLARENEHRRIMFNLSFYF